MNKINLIYADLNLVYSDFDRFLARLCLKNQQIILSKKDYNARVNSLGGMLLLNEAAIRLGTDLPEILYSDKGKPYFKNKEFHFSISHTDGFAACSYGSFESGCDIQIKKNVDLRIAERFFSEKEFAKVLEAENQQDEFFKIWCFKESAYKLTGVNDCIIENKRNIFFKDYRVCNDFYLTECAFENSFLAPEKIEL